MLVGRLGPATATSPHQIRIAGVARIGVPSATVAPCSANDIVALVLPVVSVPVIALYAPDAARPPYAAANPPPLPVTCQLSKNSVNAGLNVVVEAQPLAMVVDVMSVPVDKAATTKQSAAVVVPPGTENAVVVPLSALTAGVPLIGLPVVTQPRNAAIRAITWLAPVMETAGADSLPVYLSQRTVRSVTKPVA